MGRSAVGVHRLPAPAPDAERRVYTGPVNTPPVRVFAARVVATWTVLLSVALVATACSGDFQLVNVGVDDPHDVTAEPEVPRDDGAVAPSACNPLAWAWECLLPYPSNAFTQADPSSLTGLRVVIGSEAQSVIGGSVRFDPLGLYPADGFPVGSAILAVFPSGVDPAVLTRHFDAPERSLDPSRTTTLILRASDGAPVLHFAELDVNSDDLSRQALVLRPMHALVPATRYIVAMRGLSTRSGSPTLAPSSFIALRDDTPSDDPRIEASRARYEGDIFPALAAAGWPRSELQLAWDFTVGSESTDRADAMAVAERYLSDNGPPTVEVLAVDDAPSAHIAVQVRARFTMVNVLEATSDAWGALLYRDTDGKVAAQGTRPVDFLVAVPTSVASRPAGSAPAPILIVGHEFFGGANEMTQDALGGTLEALGAVGVATDWIGMNAEAVPQILADIQNLSTDGLRFTDLVHQALVNVRGLRAVVTGPLTDLTALQRDGASIYDPAALSFYGVGQGHILGAAYLGLDPGMPRGILVGGSGGFATIFSRARNFSVFIGVLRGQVASDLELQKLLQMSLFGLERIDSLRAPTWSMSVLMQHAIGDSESPTLAVRAQARSVGASLLAPAVQPVFGLPEITGPVEAPAAILAEYDFGVDPLPGVEMTLPTADNGVHDQLQHHPAAIEQLLEFIETGTVTHTCDGPCDPD